MNTYSNGIELDKVFNITVPNIKQLFSEKECNKFVQKVKKIRFLKKIRNEEIICLKKIL